MTREKLENYITETYGISLERPWPRSPQYTVFRHPHNRKLFAVVIELEKAKLGIKESGSCIIVNLKQPPLQVGSLRREKGFFPAFHTDKNHWISALVCDETDIEKLKILIDISYEMTK